MKIHNALTVAAFALAASGLAQAATYERIYTTPGAAPVTKDGAIHSGAGNADDTALADRIAQAFAADSKLAKPGFNVTVSAKNGRVSLAGNAQNYEQSARAEKIASDIAGRANVSGTLEIAGS